MQTLEQLRYSAPSATQKRALALMEVDVYQRRRLPRPPALEATTGAGWNETIAALPLARAIARAAGSADASAWSAAFTAGGGALPDLALLAGDASAKRRLWRQLRALLARS